VAVSDHKTDRFKHNKFLRDFATVAAGYIVGQGVLRFFAAFLVGLDDKPRAALIERWIPLWNAIGFFLLAWGVYRFLLWLERRPSSDAGTVASVPQQSAPTDVAAAASRAAVPSDWKTQLKSLQKRKDVEALIEVQAELVKSLPRERADQLDRRLGRWYTKHFQRMMLTGRAAESASDVERVASYYAHSDEFGYFREILPVVRQCVELKQSLQEED